MESHFDDDLEFEMLAANLAAAFEATQPQPNVNDVTSQSTQNAHVLIGQSTLVLNAQTTEPVIFQFQTDYILSAPTIPINEPVVKAHSLKLRRSHKIRK